VNRSHFLIHFPSFRLLCLVAWLFAASAWAQAARYSFSTDGSEVTDAQTGLIWRRCSEGQTWDLATTTCTGTVTTYTHEGALTQAKTQAGWRLPNVKELSSLVDKSRVSPSIDMTAFPGTPSNYFWSSSPYAGNASYAWFVYFYYGLVISNLRTFNLHVRLVR